MYVCSVSRSSLANDVYGSRTSIDSDKTLIHNIGTENEDIEMTEDETHQEYWHPDTTASVDSLLEQSGEFLEELPQDSPMDSESPIAGPACRDVVEQASGIGNSPSHNLPYPTIANDELKS